MGVRKKTKKKNSFLPALCSVLGTVLIIVVFAVLLTLNVPRIMGDEIYTVVSGSMAPEIPVGSLIVVHPEDPLEILEDDIIAFSKDDSVVTHRVTANNTVEGRFTTKGDANEQEDISTVSYYDFIGKVIWHVPYLGGMAQILTSTVGKIYMLAVLACGIMFHMIAGKLKVLGE